MNLASRGIDFNLGREPADTFTRDQFPDLRADFILANAPFNISDWWHASLMGDTRWLYGDPPAGNTNTAWLQHMLHRLAPTGRAGILLANGSMSSSQNNEGQIRAAMVDRNADFDFIQVVFRLGASWPCARCQTCDLRGSDGRPIGRDRKSRRRRTCRRPAPA